MKSEDFTSPEDRLLHELLREQSHGADAGFLRRIDTAIHASAAPSRPPAWRSSAAKAAAVALLAGGTSWFFLHDHSGRRPEIAGEKRPDPSSINLRTVPQVKPPHEALIPKTNSTPPIAQTGHDPQFTLPAENNHLSSLGRLSQSGMSGGLGETSRGSTSPIAVARDPSTFAPPSTRHEKSGALPWMTPLASPLSTFAVDVDTASYANIQRMLAENRPIPPEAARVEECINAFRYHYPPPPSAGAPFAIGADIAACPWNPSHHLIRIAIKGREINRGDRPPTTLAPIAKDVNIQVEFNPARVAAYRLLGNSHRVLKNDDIAHGKLSSGEIAAGHSVTAIYEITPAGISAPAKEPLRYAMGHEPAALNDEWLVTMLRYKLPNGTENIVLQSPLKGAPAAMDADFQFATAAALFAMKLAGEKEVEIMPWPHVLDLARKSAGGADDRLVFVRMLEKLSASPTLPQSGRPEILADPPLVKPR